MQAEADHSSRPPLFRDHAFLGMTLAQFLGAFNDNVCKQLTLLVCLSIEGEDRQGLAVAVFSLPFILLSGFAGYLADRLPKRSIIVACKIAEVCIQLIGVLAVLASLRYSVSLRWPMLGVLGLMGAHSAIFGPAKYGILPEMLRPKDLPQANGIFQMTTFVAIIVGWVAAGKLLDVAGTEPGERVWRSCLVCAGIAVVGLVAATFTRRTRAAQPDLPLKAENFGVDRPTFRLIAADRWLLGSIASSMVFFLAGSVVHPAVNALGKLELMLDSAQTSMLPGMVAVGIAIGCITAGRLARGAADFRHASNGAVCCFLCLIFIGWRGAATQWLPAVWEVRIVELLLLGVGIGAGFLAVPLQVMIQSRPPAELKGRVLGALNLGNWIGVGTGAGYYAGANAVSSLWNLKPSAVFPMIALSLIPLLLMIPRKRIEIVAGV